MKYRNIFFMSLVLLLGVLVTNVTLINNKYFQEQTGTILSIPMWNAGGFYTIGLLLLTAGIIGLVLLPLSLKEKRVRFTLLALFVLIIVPPILNYTL